MAYFFLSFLRCIVLLVLALLYQKVIVKGMLGYS